MLLHMCWMFRNLQGLICLQAVSQYLVKELTQVLHINSHFMLLDLATMNCRNLKLKNVPTTFISDVHWFNVVVQFGYIDVKSLCILYGSMGLWCFNLQSKQIWRNNMLCSSNYQPCWATNEPSNNVQLIFDALHYVANISFNIDLTHDISCS